MAKWRSARLRRLYGKPTDPIENSDDASPAPETTGDVRATSETAPPPPKRIRREKTRPESEYELVHQMPVTPTPPDYSLLVNPLNEKQANTVAYAIHASRNNWLSGSMFETFWTRKPRGKKSSDNQPNLRDKMTKLHECAVTLGPHTFPVKLFTVKDDNVHLDEEEDRKVEEKLALIDKDKKAKEQAKEQAEKPTQVNESEPNDVKQELSISPPPTERDMKQMGPQMSVALNEDKTKEVQEVDNHLENSEQLEKHDESERTQSPADNNSIKPDEHKAMYPHTQDNMHGPLAETTPYKTADVTPEQCAPETRVIDETHIGTDGASKLDPPLSPPSAVSESQPESALLEKSSTELTGSSDHVQSSTQSKSTKGRRRGRPKSTPEQPVDPPPSTSNEVDSSERKKSFEMEKQHLEAEKRRVEELEKQLNGHNVSHRQSAVPNSSTDKEPSETAAGGVNDNIPAEPQVSPQPTETAPSTIPEQTSESQAPAPPSFGPPRAVPNELVVSKLQQMAARDPTLGELMRVVASQTASHDDIMKFQEIINRVKSSIFTLPPAPAPPKPRAKPKPKAVPQIQRIQPTYQTRAHNKAIMLAIEFDENPTERHLLPKRSILEYIPAEGRLLWSFLHVIEDNSKRAVGSEKPRQKIYTPVTATFHDIPLKVAQTLDRCVRKPEIVAYYMKETMASAVRSEPWYLWYRIEKNDEVLLESMKKLQVPTMAPPPPPRKPMKPRKLKPHNNTNENLAYVHHHRPGEPLVQTHPMIVGRRGQPMVQPPSYYQHIQRKTRGAMSNRISTTTSGFAPIVAPPAGNAMPRTSEWSGNPSGQPLGPELIGRKNPEGGFQTPMNLPSPASIHLPSVEMPPLPRSMQLDNTEEPQTPSQTNTMESKMEIDT